jgi:(2R)-ethylmalonyl-CoA mutase
MNVKEMDPALKDEPWLMRTYSGYASARASNQLFRTNLAKGQTGLSIAFDLPTQTGYDSDHGLARGEVGKLGVPMRSLADMETLFNQIPIERMNTSMTINAPAAWILALYLSAARRQAADLSHLQGTTQNDILKEYLSRGTYIFPPKASMRLAAEVIGYTFHRIPRWNPINICSYHLQESGAEPVQELAFTLANAISVLDAVRDAGDIAPADFPQVVGRMSFFLNAGIRFIEEMCKVRVFSRLWDRICSGSHLKLVPEVLRGLKERGLEKLPVLLGGIIPENDIQEMPPESIRRVFAPRDYNLNRIMSEIVDIVAAANAVTLP